jgi:hypothetical protein
LCIFSFLSRTHKKQKPLSHIENKGFPEKLKLTFRAWLFLMDRFVWATTTKPKASLLIKNGTSVVE